MQMLARPRCRRQRYTSLTDGVPGRLAFAFVEKPIFPATASTGLLDCLPAATAVPSAPRPFAVAVSIAVAVDQRQTILRTIALYQCRRCLLRVGLATAFAKRRKKRSSVRTAKSGRGCRRMALSIYRWCRKP